jgi:phage shock protein A
MAIRLFDRIATLLKADAHGVVESLEERSLLLKQYVREAEIELNQKQARLEAVREDEKRLREQLARQEEEVRSLDEDIALAQIEQRSAEGQALADSVAAQQAQFDSLRTRVRAELARGRELGPSAWTCDAVVADEEVEIELMRRRQSAGGGR